VSIAGQSATASPLCAERLISLASAANIVRVATAVVGPIPASYVVGAF